MPSTDPAQEASFFRQLQQVTTRIHETDNLEQIMLDASPAICQLLGADRFTLYVLSDDQSAIVSRVKTGLKTAKELKLPIGPQSIAGFVALTQRTLNIADVYDEAELQRLDPRLTYLKEVDRRSGYRTRQMLVAPITRAGVLQGVFQVINRHAEGAFGLLEQEGVQQLCETLSTAIRQRAVPARATAQTSRYHGLVADGIVTADELTRCMQAARAQSIPVENALVSELGVTLAQLGASMARFFQTSYVAYNAKRLRSDALQGKLKREFVQTHQWIPLEDTPDGLLVMALDPEDVRNSRIVPQVFPQFAKCVYAVTTAAEFEQTVEQFWGEHTKEDRVEDLLADLAPGDSEADGNENALASAAQDNDLVKFVNKVIIDGYRQGASDIHFEPLPGKAKAGIRFRIDGSLQPYAEVPASHRDAIVARLKIMCDLDISEKRRPQDGKIKFKKYGPLDIELRVATLPSSGGVEDVVMRILAAGEPIPLDKLGLTPHNRERLVGTISKPYGLFYVCGPTGSGKTTTLHSILKHLNTPETKIWTAEDPVEITQKGLRQVQVNKKAGIDFALVMRAFLRADPDIIMVGESRDKETVSMGVEASLTGHLVFSTLHTNSAPESITRLLDMGMDPFNFADALLGILAQRLAKRLCDCKEAYEPTHAEVQAFVAEYSQEMLHTPAWQANPAVAAERLLSDWTAQHGQNGTLKLYRATGCETCRGTGYKGRLGLHELLVADDTTRKLIQERARVADLFTACITGGMRTLKMDGMEKVLMGLTDLKQVRAVCVK
ncbi:MAG: GspE/PulE family protein [Burkholderiales bacterium]|nr:GspE/PulE family protein [Burkholderiales bacterium]